MKALVLAALAGGVLMVPGGQPPATSVSYPAKAGPGAGRHVVLLSGDEEYRGEEGLPMLGKILSQRHGFRVTVLFSVDDAGAIDPTAGGSLSHPEALDSADAIVMALRFRHWPDETMARFERRLRAGVPIVALRTSTHAFSGLPKDGRWASWNYDNAGGFGKRVLGETWLTHWGKHKVEGTRGVIVDRQRQHPVLRGVSDIFGDTDVYEAYPPPDAAVLVRGLVVTTLDPAAPPAGYRKARVTDKQEQGVNDPPMAVAWTRELEAVAGGATNRILTTTMGSATDLQNEGLRRMVVNGVYWGLGLDVPDAADVRYVDPYDPSFYGFGGYRQGLHAADFELGRTVPGEPLRRPGGQPAQALSPVLSEPRGLQDWDLDGSGAWAVHGNVLTLEKAGTPGGPIRRPAAIAVLKSPPLASFTMRLELRSTAPVDLDVRDVLLIFGYQSPTRFYYVHLSARTDPVHNGIFVVADADRRRLDDPTSTARLRDQAWRRVRLERDAASGRIAVFFDDEAAPALQTSDRTLTTGRVGVGSFDETGEFRSIVVTPAVPSR